MEFEEKPTSLISPAASKLEPPSTEGLEDFELDRKEGTKIIEFLKKLNNDPLNIAKSVQEFENYYFERSLNLTKDEVRALLWGCGKLRGLLYFCGDSQGYIAGNSCMQLFSKFLKFEYTSTEADKFIEVFGQTKPSLIKQMSLENYIKGITSMDNSGLLVLYYYIRYNIHGISQPDEIIKDKQSIIEYSKWYQNKIACGYLQKMSVRKDSSKGTMAIEEDKDHQEEICVIPPADIMTKSLGIDFRPSVELCEDSINETAPYISTLMEQLDGYSGWNIIDSIDSDNIKLYGKGKSGFRITMQLNTEDVQKAAKCVYEIEKLQAWGNLKWNILRKDGDFQEVIHIMLPASLLIKYKYTEYILYKTMKTAEDGQSVIIAERSLILPPCEISEVKRVNVNGCIRKLSKKVDTEGHKFVECQTIMLLDEGFMNSLEYIKFSKKELSEVVSELNKLVAK